MTAKGLMLASALLACGALQGLRADTFTMTVASDPKGRTFKVDGGSTVYTAPFDFQWNSGEYHFITWDTPQASGGVNYTFKKWADGPGDNPRGIIMPRVNTYLTGKFDSSGTPTGGGVKFVPLNPCRLVDTRYGNSYGYPTMNAGETRTFSPQGRCGLPYTAGAYILNVTVVPKGPLGYLSLWPTGGAQPTVSTLNAPDGAVVANAALVPAGTNGNINVFVTDATDVVIDVNGYFDTGSTTGYSFYTLNPCRVVDTRYPVSQFGGPSMYSGQSRDFLVSSSNCVPTGSGAVAYSLNATVVPASTLAFLTLWPSGYLQPYVSTLNSPLGKIVANAAIIPAGINGGVAAYVTDQTDLVLDINGYFAAPGQTGSLLFYPVTPCRTFDSRLTNGTFGGPILEGNSTRSIPIRSGACGIPATAQAYSLNVTVVPQGPLGYLTAYPTGGVQPQVSTLNSLDGRIVANAAIVPADSNGSVNVFVTNKTHVIVDINGYFAPPAQ